MNLMNLVDLFTGDMNGENSLLTAIEFINMMAIKVYMIGLLLLRLLL